MRLYNVSNFLLISQTKLANMKHDAIAYPAAANILDDDDKKVSSNKLKEVFPAEKERAQKERSAIYDLNLPAPFYDELHFVNYE